MNKIRKNIYILIIAAANYLLVTNVFSGTILSSFGLGAPSVTFGSRAMGMGFISVSQDSPFYINLVNPASLFRIKTTMISVQYVYTNNNYSDSQNSASSHYSNVNGFAFALPVTSRIGFSLQFSPSTRVDYLLSFEGKNGGYDFTQSVEGMGGLNNFKLSSYFSPFPNFSLGFSGLYTFGRIDETWAVDYNNSNFSSTGDLFLSRNTGYGFICGFLYRPVKILSIGAAYSPSMKLNTNTDTSYRFETDKYTFSSTHILPSWVKAGASLTLFKKLILGTEVGFTKWDEFKLNDKSIANIKNTQSISLGLEFLPTSKPTDSYIKKISYRAGFCSKPYFYLSPNGETIHETWLTFGFGFPLYGGSKIDFAFNFGRRGSLDKNGIEENLFRLGVSVTTGEKWFMRRY
ncbi:hypothetical protein J7K93_09000 [bacterium]|nr:hypothetical protein [bacterium]